MRVLDAIGAENARVFDAFAGAGTAYYSVWKRAASYVGCDLKWYRDERQVYVADNRRVLRLLDLVDFNVFDFDAYGSPWEQAYIMSARRKLSPGERFGIVFTDGSGLKLKFGAAPTALGLLANVPLKAAGLSRQQGKIIDSGIEAIAARLGGAIVERWQAIGKTGARMRYIGMVVEGHKKRAILYLTYPPPTPYIMGTRKGSKNVSTFIAPFPQRRSSLRICRGSGLAQRAYMPSLRRY